MIIDWNMAFTIMTGILLYHVISGIVRGVMDYIQEKRGKYS